MMWLRVEEGDIDAARQLRVQVSTLKEGKSKKKRSWWVCWHSTRERQNGLGLRPRAKEGEKRPEKRREPPAGAATRA